MACCAALTLLFSWMYRAVRWALPGREDDGFAPAATWPPVPERPAIEVPRQPRELFGRACIVAGLAWFVAGVLAMHVFHAIPPIRDLPVDVAFHASGLWLATAGMAVLALPRHRIPTRSAA